MVYVLRMLCSNSFSQRILVELQDRLQWSIFTKKSNHGKERVKANVSLCKCEEGHFNTA